MPAAGHIVTQREHTCGDFKDEFDWTSIRQSHLRVSVVVPEPRRSPGRQPMPAGLIGKNMQKEARNKKKNALMKDLQAQAEKLRKDAAECALIRDLATAPHKQQLFDRLAKHLNILADEVEKAIANEAGQATKPA